MSIVPASWLELNGMGMGWNLHAIHPGGTKKGFLG